MNDPHSIYKVCFLMVKQAVTEFFSSEEDVRVEAEDYIFDEDSRIIMKDIDEPNFFAFDNCCYFLTKYPQFSGKDYKSKDYHPVFNADNIREKLLRVRKSREKIDNQVVHVEHVVLYQMNFEELLGRGDYNVQS